VLVTLATLTIATASTARPPTSSARLDAEDFQTLVLAGTSAPDSTPWPTFELAAPVPPIPIGDFEAPAREFEPRATPNQPTRGGSVAKPTYRRSGVASWYCKTGVSECHYSRSGGMYAAAGPALRVGDWRGRTVRACARGRCVKVTLIDWCECYGSRVIDLYSDAYRRLAALSSGTIRVTVTW